MKVIRTTIVTPRAGAAEDVAELLKELGGYLSKQPGFVEDYAFQVDGQLGRISVWASREAADAAAGQIHTIALRAKVHSLTLPERQEHLLQIQDEHHAATAVAA